MIPLRRPNSLILSEVVVREAHGNTFEGPRVSFRSSNRISGIPLGQHCGIKTANQAGPSAGGLAPFITSHSMSAISPKKAG